MTKRRSMTRFIGLQASRDGVAAIEFALISPLLFVLVFGVIEVASVMFVNASMEGAVREASRFGITGCEPVGLSRRARAEQILSDGTYGLVDLSDANTHVEVTRYPDIEALGDPEREEVLDDGLGKAGDYVLYRFKHQRPLFTGRLIQPLGFDGTVPLAANIVVRNELWEGGGESSGLPC